MFFRLCVSSVLFAALALTLSAADWAQFRGPNGNGIAPDRGLNKAWERTPPRLLWTAPLTDNGYAGPAVAGGTVYLIDHQDRQDIVKAFALDTGRELWRYAYHSPAGNNYGFARATPAVAGGKVYTLSQTGVAYCLDAGNGKRIWSRDLPQEFGGKKPQWDYSMSLLVDGKNVIAVPGGRNATVVALDAASGKTRWQCGNDGAGYATPVIATLNGKKQYVVFAATSLIGVDATTGKQLWSFPWETEFDANVATPAISGNSIFITSNYNHGCALVDITGGTAKARWQNKHIMAHVSSPIIVNGYIYGTGEPGNLVCLELKTGQAKWKKSGFEKGGLIGVDGALIVFDGRSGDLVMVNLTPTAYQELGRFKPLGGQSWTAPVIANGKLLIRNKTKLACYALK